MKQQGHKEKPEEHNGGERVGPRILNDGEVFAMTSLRTCANVFQEENVPG